MAPRVGAESWVKPTTWCPGTSRSFGCDSSPSTTVEIGAADPAGRHPQQDLPRLGFRRQRLLEPHQPPGRVEHHRAHRDIVSLEGPSTLARWRRRCRMLVHGSGDPGAGGGTDPPLVWECVGQPDSSRRLATSPPSSVTPSSSRATGTACCAASSTSAATAAHVVASGGGEPRDAAVPVSRLDVRARRPPPQGAAQRGGAGLPAGRARPRARRGRHLGAFVFVNACADPEPLAQALGSLPAQVAELGGRRLARPPLALGGRDRGELEDRVREISRVLPLLGRAPGVRDVGDVSPEAYLLSTEAASRRSAARSRTVDPEDELPRAQFVFLWPNLGINIFPGRPNISIGPIVPLAPTGPIASSTTSSARGRAGLDRRPPRIRRPGRTGGPRARRGRAARRRRGRVRARRPHEPQRAADRPLPGAHRGGSRSSTKSVESSSPGGLEHQEGNP